MPATLNTPTLSSPASVTWTFCVTSAPPLTTLNDSELADRPIAAGRSTVIAAVALPRLPEAVIVAWPGFFPVTKPVDTTLATVSSLDDHDSAPLALRADNCTDPPTDTDACVGVIVNVGPVSSPSPEHPVASRTTASPHATMRGRLTNIVRSPRKSPAIIKRGRARDVDARVPRYPRRVMMPANGNVGKERARDAPGIGLKGWDDRA